MMPLEILMDRLEAALSGLSQALQRNDTAHLERQALELHRALSVAVDAFSTAAKAGSPIPPLLRERLLRASADVAAQREVLSRATAALDRALDVLIPNSRATPVYGQQGRQRQARSGFASA